MPNKKQNSNTGKLNNKVEEISQSAAKMAGDTFDHLKKHFDSKKVDAFQEKWLKVPANRKKYQKITDAPEVAFNEVKDITNDLINYLQGQEAGQSSLLKKVHSTVGSFFKNPAQFIQQKASAGKEVAMEIKQKAEKKAESATQKLSNKASKAPKKTTKAVKPTPKKSQKTKKTTK